MNIDIEVRGIDAAKARLDVDVLGVLAPVLNRSALRMADQLRRYPSAPGAGEWKAKTSTKQKRAFFALLRRGAISGKRTGRLGRGWAVSQSVSAGGIVTKLSNAVPYARFVQGDSQASFHRGRWTTDSIVVSGEVGRLESDAIGTLSSALGS